MLLYTVNVRMLFFNVTERLRASISTMYSTMPNYAKLSDQPRMAAFQELDKSPAFLPACSGLEGVKDPAEYNIWLTGCIQFGGLQVV